MTLVSILDPTTEWGRNWSEKTWQTEPDEKREKLEYVGQAIEMTRVCIYTRVQISEIF